MELIYICAAMKHLAFGELFAGFVHSPLSLFPINHQSLFLTSKSFSNHFGVKNH